MHCKRITIDVYYSHRLETANNQAEKIAEAKAVVEAGDKEMSGGEKLMTEAETKIWRRNYNNVHNEGGSGFIPHRTSVEYYNYSKSILEEAK